MVQNFKTVLIESELFLPLDEKWAALKKVVLIEYFCPDLFIIYDKSVESKQTAFFKATHFSKSENNIAPTLLKAILKLILANLKNYETFLNFRNLLNFSRGICNEI